MDLDVREHATEPRAILVSVAGDPPAPGGIEQVMLDLSKFHNGRWALQLDAAFTQRGTPVVILARGLACLAVSWWAQLSPRSYLRQVQGAVFESPLSVDFQHVAAAASIRTGPTYRLPFPSIVVSDGSFQIEQVLALADKWGSQLVTQPSDMIADHTNRQAASDGTAQLLAYAQLLDRSGHDTPEPAKWFRSQPLTGTILR